MPEASGNQKVSERYHKASESAAVIKEYTLAIERAPVLQARALDDPFRLLADINGVVLCHFRYRPPERGVQALHPIPEKKLRCSRLLWLRERQLVMQTG